MAPLGYIEILDGKGGVVERFRVDGFRSQSGAPMTMTSFSATRSSARRISRSRRTSKGV